MRWFLIVPVMLTACSPRIGGHQPKVVPKADDFTPIALGLRRLPEVAEVTLHGAREPTHRIIHILD